MQPKTLSHWIFVCILLAGVLIPPAGASAAPPFERLEQESTVTAFDLIIAMNTLRMSYGLPALIEDPIVNAVAQATAETMAATQASWHIGDVSGRLAASGYGGGVKVWATENFAVGGRLTLDEIMFIWSDPSHMIPAVNPAYCHIGAGTAKAANGSTYYVLQAAYTASNSCGTYGSVAGTATSGGSTGGTSSGTPSGVSQLIIPVQTATPDEDGNVYHLVKAGQSFWAIAMAYKTTIKELEVWNNLSSNSKLQIGQRLFIPGPNTAGYSTPTPVGMVQVSTPGPDGKIVHTVQTYQTLSTIAQAYQVSVDTILAFNGLQLDWPLQVGQQLLIYPGDITPSPTPRPLTPIEKLTPEADGKYYHTVRSGENLSWIADLYEVPVIELMNWNNLTASSVLQIDQKLVLQVTPPVVPTHTPTPYTPTVTATAAPFTATPSLAPTRPPQSPTPTAEPTAPGFTPQPGWFMVVGLAVGGSVLVFLFTRRKPQA